MGRGSTRTPGRPASSALPSSPEPLGARAARRRSNVRRAMRTGRTDSIMSAHLRTYALAGAVHA
eukprot:6270360-Alexandrium_andersonii.AAC.1